MRETSTTISTSSRYYNKEAQAKSMDKMKIQIHKLRYISVASSIIAIVAFATTVIAFNRYSKIEAKNRYNAVTANTQITNLENVVEKQDSDIVAYQNDIVTVTNAYNQLYNDFVAMTEMNTQLAEENANLKNGEVSDNEELNDLRHRAELYDKYNYAIINSMDENLPEDQRRTDITYDQIDMLETLANDIGLSEDAVSLVLAIAMNESRGQEKAKNPHSTATGYCGILDFTGKYLYEDIMGNSEGSYSHDMCYNGYLNLELCLQYIRYLNNMFGGDVTKVVNSYRGYKDYVYDSELDANLQKAGKSLYTLNLSGGD